MLQRHIERIVRFPWTTILLTLFVTLFFALQFRSLFMVLDPKAILPQNHPYVQLNNEIEQRFGGSRVVVIGIHSKDGDIFNPQDIEKIRRITDEVKKVPGILENNVVSITDHKVKYVQSIGDQLKITGLAEGIPDTPEGMAQLRERVFSNPMFVNSLISKDGTSAAIITDFKGGAGEWWKKQQGGDKAVIWPKPEGASSGLSGSGAASAGQSKESWPSEAYQSGGEEKWKQNEKGKWPSGGSAKSWEQWYVSDSTIHQKLLEIVSKEKDDRTEIYLGGLPVALSYLEADSWRMSRYVYPLAIVVIMGVLYLAFRSFQGMLLPMVCAFLSVIWAVGMMGLFRIPLDPWNMMTPILILAVAAGHSVQILKRYYEELGGETSQDSKQAVLRAVGKIGPVMITAGLVAAASFASLVTFELKTFQSFGLFTAFGILSAVVLEMTFIPAARSLMRVSARGIQVTGITDSLLDRFFRGIAHLTAERRGLVWTGTAVVIVAAGIGISQLTILNSLKSLFFESTPLRQDQKALNRDFGGTATFYVYFEGKEPDSLKDPLVLKGIEGLQRELETLPEVGKTQSFVDYVKAVNQSLHEGDPSYRVVPESRSAVGEYLFLFSISGSQGEMDRLVDYEYKRAVIWVYLKDDSSALGEKLVGLVDRYKKEYFPDTMKVGVAGSIPVMMALNQTMVEGKIKNILQILGIVFVLSVIAFRSVLAGLFVLTPLVLAVLINFGILGWLGIGLGIGTAAISAMAVGFGADYAIYLLSRIREEMKKGGSGTQAAIERSLLTAGKAVFFVALAISAGGVTLLFTGYYIHMEGFLIPLAMLTSCLAALILLPVLAGIRPGSLGR